MKTKLATKHTYTVTLNGKVIETRKSGGRGDLERRRGERLELSLLAGAGREDPHNLYTHARRA